jgi:hypothetical protein
MDWYTIEYLYPKGFKKFAEIMFPNVGVLSLNTLEYYDIKKLYQFFDKEGIYLTVEMLKQKRWVYDISLHNGIVLGPSQETVSTREDAELNGFLECFKLLNKSLIDSL